MIVSAAHLLVDLMSAYRVYLNKQQAAVYLTRVSDRVLDDIGIARGDVFK